MNAHTKRLITQEGKKAQNRIERLTSWLEYICANYIGTIQEVKELQRMIQKEANKLMKISKRIETNTKTNTTLLQP